MAGILTSATNNDKVHEVYPANPYRYLVKRSAGGTPSQGESSPQSHQEKREISNSARNEYINGKLCGTRSYSQARVKKVGTN
jgi:hypothetical protein